MDPFTYFPPFNTTTLIKPMNEEEEESHLEGSRVRRNHLARERHAARFKEQRAADASRRVAQKAARSNAQIATNATRQAAQRATHSDMQIALENATCVNARMLLHPNRQ
jgi:hypothetical protein